MMPHHMSDAAVIPDIEATQDSLPPVHRVFGGWRPVHALVASVGGFGVSIYVTIVHFEPQALICAANPFISCTAVLHSPQSVIFGIPVPFYGLFWFGSMFVLSLPAMWNTTKWWLPWARLAWSLVGIGFIFNLIYDELFVIDKLCEWCTIVHLFTFTLFVIVVTGWDRANRFVVPRD